MKSWISTFCLSLALIVILTPGTDSLSAQAVQQEEAEDYFKKWLNEDVLYIITEEEREVFRNLSTVEEKERFIEQFWFRRDPTPENAYNDYKVEHYRRIQYANEQFTSGQPGWKTDRGRIYIKFGPPDRRDANPTGGYYERPTWEGGGSTNTFPWERWEYRHLEGVGDDVEIDFVDDTLTGEYRMTTNPDDKDALLILPEAGMTEAEAMGNTTRVDRILRRTNPMSWNNPLLVGYGRLKDQPFEKLHLFTDLQRPPSQKFQDLYRPEVFTEVRYQELPIEVGSDLFPAADKYLVPVTVLIDNEALNFVPAEIDQTLQAVLEVYGRLTGIGGHIIETFEETVASHALVSELGQKQQEKSMYQRTFQLAPGRYKLDIIVRDPNGDRLGTHSTGIILPRPEEGLAVSSVILADRVEVAPATNGAFGPAFVVPNLRKAFDTSQELLVFYQLSNFAADSETSAPRLESGVEIFHQEESVNSEKIRIDESNGRNRPRLHLVHKIPLTGLQPGKYLLRLSVLDEISGETLQREVTFQISPSQIAAKR